jgi:hypothetical protein
MQRHQQRRRTRVSTRLYRIPALSPLVSDFDLLRGQVGRRFEAMAAEKAFAEVPAQWANTSTAERFTHDPTLRLDYRRSQESRAPVQMIAHALSPV